MERRVLGKGLDALIPKKATSISPKEFIHLELEKVVPAGKQPRQQINQEELAELAGSIKEKGFIQPIVVRQIGQEKFEIIAGERRYLAAKYLRLKEIPTIVKNVGPQEAFILAIVENLQRKNLNPMEEAQAFSRLIAEFGFSLADIAQFVGKDKTTIVNAVRLLKLPEKVQQALRVGAISRSQARTILAVENKLQQNKLFEQILQGGMSVRDIEKKVRRASGKNKKNDPFVEEMEEKLQKLLGTKVKIYNRKNNRGKIVVEYYDLKDFERILKKIT
jgi:ParB family transcriptional regulator, chromosome partitioning protein